MENWKIIKSTLILKTPWFSLKRDKCLTPENKIVPEYYTWEKQDSIIIFPITKDNHVLLIKQYRHGVKRVCVDYPGGTIEENQTMIDATHSELMEETGYDSNLFFPLGSYLMDSSYSNQKTHFILALNCEKRISIHNPQEITEVIMIPFEEIKEFAKNNIECLLCRHLTIDALSFIQKWKGE